MTVSFRRIFPDSSIAIWNVIRTYLIADKRLAFVFSTCLFQTTVRLCSPGNSKFRRLLFCTDVTSAPTICRSAFSSLSFSPLEMALYSLMLAIPMSKWACFIQQVSCSTKKAKHPCQVHSFNFLLGRSLTYLCLCYSLCLVHVFLIGAGWSFSAFLLPVIAWITNNRETGYPTPFINDICCWNTLREFQKDQISDQPWNQMPQTNKKQVGCR